MPMPMYSAAPLDDFIHELVAAADGFAQVAAAQVGQVVAEHFGEEGLLAVFDAGLDLLEDGGAAGEGLEAAFVAAAAFGAVDVQDHVADLAGGVVEAAVEVAVDDQAAADAGADEDADEALGLGLEFGDMDAQRGRCCSRSPRRPARRGASRGPS